MVAAGKYTLDQVVRRIVAELGRDARLSIRALAERVHVSRTAAHTRLTALIANGVITGFAATVDRAALGLNLTAVVMVKVDADWPTVSAALAALPFVEKAQALSGDIDILLTVSAPNHEQLSETILRRIHTIPGVASTRSYMILEEMAGTAPQDSTDAWRL
jgi:DNA-binding Lrp family transcriptional regulator